MLLYKLDHLTISSVWGIIALLLYFIFAARVGIDRQYRFLNAAKILFQATIIYHIVCRDDYVYQLRSFLVYQSFEKPFELGIAQELVSVMGPFHLSDRSTHLARGLTGYIFFRERVI